MSQHDGSRSRVYGRKIAVAVLAALLFTPVLGGGTALADDPARQNGDLFVGGASFVDGYGSTAGGVWRVRGTTPTLFCASPVASDDPGFWNEPRSLIVDSRGRIVFLADIGGQNIGLLRCDKMGDSAERLALLRLRDRTPAGWPEPFPNRRFGSRMGSLHIMTQRAVTDDLQSAPKVVTEDAYEFVVQDRADAGDPSVPGRTEMIRYGADSGEWLSGVDLPGIVQSGNLVSAVAHGDSLYSFNGSVLRRTSMPLKLSLQGRVRGVDFKLTYTPFGGVHEFSGITDNTTIPNVSSGCNTDPPGRHDDVTDLMPWQGGFAPLSGDQISYDEHGDLGLVIRTGYGPMPGPYMTHVSSALLNDDPQDDHDGYFHQPFNGCVHVPWIQYSPILPWTSPSSTVAFDNTTDYIATAPGGMVGTSFWGNRVVRLTPGDKATVIAELYHPTTVAAYPAIVPQLGTVVYITVHSPVDVLVVDAAGRRIGVDPVSGLPVNDFILGFDSGPGEPRVFAIKDPAPGPYHVQSVGTGSGPYTIDVSSANLSTGATSRIQTTGTASVGAVADRDFVLSATSRLAFAGSVDTTAPTSISAQTPAANAAGWNTGDVTVALSATDEAGGSGVKQLTYSATGAQPIAATSLLGSSASVALTAEGETALSYFATDNAGNTELAKTVSVKIDNTKPTITGTAAPGANAAGWNNGDVTVTFACADAGSGIASCPAAVTLSSEGAGQSATGTATDRAGNGASLTVSGINIDRTAPHTTLTQSPAPNAAGWNNGPVSMALAASDGLSGVAITETSVDGAPFAPYTAALTLATDGTHTLRFRSTDRAGNVEPDQTVAIKLDATKPTITGAESPVANRSGWHNADVLVTFTCADLGSGIASCTAPVGLAAEGAGQGAVGTAVDLAGNTATSTVSGINIDKTAPRTTATRSTIPNAAGWDRAAVTVTLVATDALSGVALTEVSVGGAPFAPYTGPLTVSADGMSVLRYRSTDRAGNVEAEQTLTLRIDRVAPEAIIGFDPATGDIVVTGSDALSGVPAGAIAPIMSARARENTTRRTYVVTDRAGNTLSIVIDVKRDGQELTATVVSLSYNGAAAIVAPRNRLTFEWSFQGVTIRELQQQIEIGSGAARVQVKAEYDSRSAVTRITVQKGGSDQQGEAEQRGQYPRQIVRPGLVLLQVTTDRGSLAIAY